MLGELLLGQVGSIGKLLFALVLDGCLVDVPAAITLRGVGQRTAIG